MPVKVAYMLSKFISKSDEFIPTNNRNAMVHSLIESCGLLKHLSLVASVKASFEELSLFHSQDYLNYLKEENEFDDLNESFGFAYDCPLKPGIYEYCQEVAGASMSAAKLLCSGHFQVAINWLGGWHHAKRSEAAGYCYVNDCVLSILQLRKTFGRVLYVDLDLHHGDGVQDAFCGTNKVLTFSVHKYEAGFFPGSGSIDDIGIGRGFRYSTNLPLKDGITDDPFIETCCKVLTEIKFRFKPLAIVIQAGADGLNEDPMASFNLTPKSLSSCVQFVLKWGLPTLILGGGGYNESNVARCWTRITADILNIELPMEIPEDDYFTSYGPSFDFEVIEGMKKDQNSKEYLKEMTDNIFGNLTKLT